MNREFLKNLGLEDTHIEEIMKEHGKTIANTQTELETLKSDKETLQEQLDERNNDLKALQESTTNSEETQKQLTALQTRYDTEKEEWETKYEANARKAALDVLVAELGVIDPVAMKAHILDTANEAEFKDGELVGLKEHAKGLLDDKLSYLLPQENKSTGGRFNNPPNPQEELEAKSAKAMGIK